MVCFGITLGVWGLLHCESRDGTDRRRLLRHDGRHDERWVLCGQPQLAPRGVYAFFPARTTI